MNSSTGSTPEALRLLDALDAYARIAHMLRFSALGQPDVWHTIPLTMPQIRALANVAAAGSAGRSGRELAAHLGVGPSAVTALIDRLVEHQFVSRHEDVYDRRIQRVRVTAEGTEMLQRLASVRREVLAEIVTRIDPDDMPLVERALGILQHAVLRLAADQAHDAARPPDAPRKAQAVLP